MIRPLLVSFGALTLLTGLVYPAAVTGAARLLFPTQAGGSPLVVDGQVRGSALIGQATEDPRYFWSRPSATGTFPTNAEASGGSCQAPSTPAFAKAVAKRIQALQASDPAQTAPVPQDLVTASGSGLDPHISLEAARWQAPRVARSRNLPSEQILALVESRATRSMLGTRLVRVLELNAALDALARNS